MVCKDFPACSRSGCGRPACDHTEALRSILGVCVGYIGYRDCLACDMTSWAHDEDAPHGIPEVCAGYDPGEEPQPFNGEGGGFGGGGASGGW